MMIAMVVMGSEFNSKDDEGGDTEQLMSTFKLEVESDIEEEDDFEDDSFEGGFHIGSAVEPSRRVSCLL
eukprot:scaffold1216_cov63-Cyclotella_meneghiniana.AAC.1